MDKEEQQKIFEKNTEMLIGCREWRKTVKMEGVDINAMYPVVDKK